MDWISTKDEVPGHLEDVLVHHEDGFYMIGYCSITKGSWICDGYKFSAKEITHFARLKKPVLT